MKIKLIALVALAMAEFTFLGADVAADEAFEVDADDAEGLLTNGKAKIATAVSPAGGKAEKKVKARVLSVCAYGKPNDLVELGTAEAKAAEEDGLVDTDKAAVAYAAALDQNASKPKGPAKA